MSRFRFWLATLADDAALRERMAADWMPGRISVSFRREPSFFDAAKLQGERSETILCTDTHTGRLAGLGTRASGTAYLNGVPTRIGYLSDLRCAPQYRCGTVLARGYRFLRDLHEADPLPLYTTVIYEDNAPALAALLGARAGLPEYRDCGRLRTPALLLGRTLPQIQVAGITITRAEPEHTEPLLRFLNARLATRQFAPVFGTQDLMHGRLGGLAATDFLLAERDGRIAGAIALWDQSRARQTHVEAYRGMLARMRPLYNLYAGLARRHPLPAPGARLPCVYLACFAVAQDDLSIGRALLRSAVRTAGSGLWHYAIAGLHERDPLAPLLDEYRRIDVAGRVFVVHYPGEGAVADALDARPPYLEAGCL